VRRQQSQQLQVFQRLQLVQEASQKRQNQQYNRLLIAKLRQFHEETSSMRLRFIGFNKRLIRVYKVFRQLLLGQKRSGKLTSKIKAPPSLNTLFKF
jgi:hypothetical protein